MVGLFVLIFRKEIMDLAVKKTTKETITRVCTCCGKDLAERNYYKSSSILYKYITTLSICKDCTISLYDEYLKSTDDAKISVYRVCQLLDYPFIETAFTSALNESQSRGTNLFQVYLKNINSLKQYGGYSFENGDTLKTEETIAKDNELIEENKTDRDIQNEKDVIRMLGYDPFESENPKDRKYLFNRLVDFLDDSTLEDSFKLLSVIELVKSYNQIDKINASLASMTQDLQGMVANSGGIKSLIDSKKNILTTVLNMAKDNGISVNHNNNKSKGGGTLSGIIKQLQEIGLDQAEVNLYNIETQDGMRQVADISNESIKKQLQFDENDYVDMLSQQREMIENMDKKLIDLEEENRLLKIALKTNKNEN